MKFLMIVPALAGFLLLAAPLQAQTRLATIDVKKVFDGYWKTKQADATLKDSAADFDKKRKGMLDDYQKANDEYKKLLDSANDQAVSTEERERRKKAAETRLLEIREIEQSVQQFDRSARTTLAEQQRRMRDNILKEIQASIDAKARSAGYSLVLDTAAESINNTPMVMFSDGKSDITDDILSQLNATAPLGLSTPEDQRPEPRKK